jgi:hypothetical protein
MDDVAQVHFNCQKNISFFLQRFFKNKKKILQVPFSYTNTGEKSSFSFSLISVFVPKKGLFFPSSSVSVTRKTGPFSFSLIFSFLFPFKKKLFSFGAEVFGLLK